MSKKKKAAPDARACAIYARYSSNRQREESIEQQIEVCTRWAEREGLEVAAVYADKHISGTTDARPQFQQMILDAEIGLWATVVVYKLDRFARDRYDAAVYRRKLTKCGVKLMSAQEQIPDAPEGVMLEAMLEGMNEYYSKNLSQNVKRGMYDNAAKCKANGVKLMGYTINKQGFYEINEREAEIIRQIFTQFAAGTAKADVLAWAKSQGLKTRMGKEMNYNALRGIVENEKYKGVYTFGSTRVVDGMPAIVEPDLWEEANKRIHTMPRKYQFPLTGIMYDKTTGEQYFGSGGTSATGRRYLYYAVQDGNSTVRLSKYAVERSVVQAIAETFSKPRVAHEIAEAFVNGLSERASQSIKSLENEISALRTKEQNILKALEDGIATQAMIERSRELESQRIALESQLSRRRAAIPPVSVVEGWLREDFPCESNEELIRAAVERVEIDRTTGDVEINIPWLLKGSRDNEEKPSYGVVLLNSVWWAVPNSAGTILVSSWGLRIKSKLAA